MKKCCKNVNLCDKKSQPSEKSHKTVNLYDKKSQTNLTKSQKYKLI